MRLVSAHIRFGIEWVYGSIEWVDGWMLVSAHLLIHVSVRSWFEACAGRRGLWRDWLAGTVGRVSWFAVGGFADDRQLPLSFGFDALLPLLFGFVVELERT